MFWGSLSYFFKSPHYSKASNIRRILYVKNTTIKCTCMNQLNVQKSFGHISDLQLKHEIKLGIELCINGNN